MAPRLAPATILLPLLMAGPIFAESLQVRFEEGKLWVSSRAIPAPRVFSAIADETNVRFVIDKELKTGPLTIEIEGMDLERAIRNLMAALPGVAGHAMSYSNAGTSGPQLAEVSIYGPGRSFAGGTVYEGSPLPIPTPDLEDRMQRMVEAGVPQETAEKVIELTSEVQKLQATPPPGSYSPEDLSPAAREQLQPLVDRGVPMERAVQMLLLQEKYQDTLRELSEVQGGLSGLPGSTVGTPSESQPADPDQAE